MSADRIDSNYTYSLKKTLHKIFVFVFCILVNHTDNAFFIFLFQIIKN